jgi:metal-responsive CopG/Arc/MetJ family transcriptional regulator
MENRKPISLKLPPELLDKLDAYRRRQPHEPTRTQVIEDAIRAIIEKAKR